MKLRFVTNIPHLPHPLSKKKKKNPSFPTPLPRKTPLFAHISNLLLTYIKERRRNLNQEKSVQVNLCK